MGSQGDTRTPEDLFDGYPDGLVLYREVRDAVATIGEVDVQVTTSQAAFRRSRGFAYVSHPSARVWMHHIELHAAAQIDEEVRGWLAEAYGAAV